MRADIHDGPEHTLQAEAGYIDARPLSAGIDESLLQRAAGPYIWVKPGLSSWGPPVCFRQLRTCRRTRPGQLWAKLGSICPRFLTPFATLRGISLLGAGKVLL